MFFKFFGILILIITLSFAISKEKENRMKKIELNPQYPLVENDCQMTNDWSVYLPGKFNRRIEDGSLVLWRPSFTIWTNIWNNDKNETVNKRRENVINSASKDKYDEEFVGEDSLFYSYRLKENEGDKRVSAFYCFAFGVNGHVQMAIYFDDENDLKWAKQIWKSLKESPNIQDSGKNAKGK